MAFFLKREYHNTKTDLFESRVVRSQIPPWRAEFGSGLCAVVCERKRRNVSDLKRRAKKRGAILRNGKRRRLAKNRKDAFNDYADCADVAVLSGGDKR